MKNCISAALFSILLSATALSSKAQGTVSFENITSHAPFSMNGAPLGPGYFAQLQLADGTNVGDRVGLLSLGLFHGGTRTVPRQAGSSVGLKVELQDATGNTVGTTGVVNIVLGGAGTPPSPPAALLGLVPMDFSTNSIDSIPKDPKIQLELLDAAQLQLSWPEGTTLMSASSLSSGNTPEEVTPSETQDSVHRVVVPQNEPQKFFWLLE